MERPALLPSLVQHLGQTVRCRWAQDGGFDRAGLGAQSPQQRRGEGPVAGAGRVVGGGDHQ
ncbi:hypothetical protein, partial [Streptomyces sp. NRRL S-495]|uniref:hypothetical protein n=1 Tax=Streptomyces sp. NRRL S-495 TaxID=1609133 RepID=UPI00257122E7